MANGGTTRKSRRERAAIRRGLAKVGESSNKEFIGRGRNRRRNPNYDPRMGTGKKQDFVKNPLKIDMKGMTPPRQLSPGESKIRKGDINRSMPGDAGNPTTRKKKKIDLRKRNLAGQRMGQRKAGGTIKKMAMGGKMKPVDKTKNPGLAKLPTEVRNKMGFMKKGGLTDAIKKVKKKQATKMYGGGMTKKKMMGGGMTVKKMKHGGKAGKCPRDGIAMRGKTKAGR